MIKKLGLIIGIVSVVTVGLQAEGKRYEIESGIVEYKLSTSGAVMGIKSEGHGTGSLVFKEYGNIELDEEKKSDTTMGQTETTHKMTKYDKGVVYSVDFNNKVITKLDYTSMANQDVSKMGKKMMQQMGGKKVGDEKFLGYDCEVWTLMGSKLWIYKGVLLKLESSIMGVKSTKVATKAEFNIKIDDAKFKLPDFKVQTLDGMINEGMTKAREEEKKEENKPSKEEVKVKESSKALTPCQQEWKAYFDCQSGGDKDLAGYQQALGCAKLMPNPEKCPPSQVAVGGMKGEFDDAPSMD